MLLADPVMTRLEGESTLHPTLDQPAGSANVVAAGAAVDDEEVVEAAEEVVEVEEVVEAAGAAIALKTFIRQDPPHC
jgi:hypothetical protein